MKIRIEDNSVRFRLRRSEVAALASKGELVATTVFPGARFEYALKANPGAEDLIASFDGKRITAEIPMEWVRQWPDSARVGFETQAPAVSGMLHILIEKDFVCLDRNPSKQADQYPNPKSG